MSFGITEHGGGSSDRFDGRVPKTWDRSDFQQVTNRIRNAQVIFSIWNYLMQTENPRRTWLIRLLSILGLSQCNGVMSDGAFNVKVANRGSELWVYQYDAQGRIISIISNAKAECQAKTYTYSQI